MSYDVLAKSMEVYELMYCCNDFSKSRVFKDMKQSHLFLNPHLTLI